MLIIPAGIYEEMVSHCRAGLPNEVCGLLAGTGTEVAKLYPMTNAEPSPVSYYMEPKEQFAAMKDMRREGLSLLAIFHSHPVSPASPSATDVSLAVYDECLYVIVSFAQGEPVTKAFAIVEGKVTEAPFAVR